MTIYFDTSALVKLVIAEVGSNVAEELWASAWRPASNVLCIAEGRAALAAARRAERLTATTHKRAISAFEDVTAEMSLIGITEKLAHDGGLLAERFALRGYDAVHLASAMLVQAVTLVTWDNALRSAAEQARLALSPASTGT